MLADVSKCSVKGISSFNKVSLNSIHKEFPIVAGYFVPK